MGDLPGDESPGYSQSSRRGCLCLGLRPFNRHPLSFTPRNDGLHLYFLSFAFFLFPVVRCALPEVVSFRKFSGETLSFTGFN